jgi:hypothetical protein
MILASLVLAYYVSPYWYLLTVFVGLNLLQSAFTNWCPAMSIFRAMGLSDPEKQPTGGLTDDYIGISVMRNACYSF